MPPVLPVHGRLVPGRWVRGRWVRAGASAGQALAVGPEGRR
jgi:hypothetical protein